jgi:hypothetical protein
MMIRHEASLVGCTLFVWKLTSSQPVPLSCMAAPLFPPLQVIYKNQLQHLRRAREVQASNTRIWKSHLHRSESVESQYAAPPPE